MSPASALIVWGGCYTVAATLLGLALEWRRPLPPKARAVRNMAATIGLMVFFAGLVGKGLET